MRLAEIMKATGTTQQDLADYLGVNRVTVTHYVAGKREPDLTTMIKIARYFEVSLDYLAGLTDDETPKSRQPLNYVKLNDRIIRVSHGDVVTVCVGGKMFDFTFQEVEL